jgi:hypothetical protein
VTVVPPFAAALLVTGLAALPAEASDTDPTALSKQTHSTPMGEGLRDLGARGGF